ncbi:hypothetical protein BDN70DRAFT_899100 [Pholiota conissans]|uniref:Uncharacterized protein n=1 Tax=Pholiota conissans TaxID=109636 RepID=A0A9P5YUQ3_9AGAR|nr:hypothetical protein BDN70DRAFT_899100 [Pholiota conissans]
MPGSNNVFPEPHFAFELSKDTLDEMKSKFSSYLNAGMSCSLLMVSRRFHHRFRILASVTALWLCNVAQFGVEWFCTIWQFSTEGEGHKSSVMQLELEIWRCFVLWDYSWRIVFGPVFLVVAETGLLLAQIIRRAMLSSISWTSEPALLDKFDIISAAGFIVAAATTLLTTVLIALVLAGHRFAWQNSAFRIYCLF